MGMEFWSCDFWPWSYDLDLGNLVGAPVPRVFMPVWPAWACGLPMRYSCAWAWNFGPVTFDLGTMTLTLGILWTILCPRYWCQCDQFEPVDYPLGVDVHGHGILVLWPLTLLIWPCSCVFLMVMHPPLAGPLLTWSAVRVLGWKHRWRAGVIGVQCCQDSDFLVMGVLESRLYQDLYLACSPAEVPSSLYYIGVWHCCRIMLIKFCLSKESIVDQTDLAPTLPELLPAIWMHYII